MKNFLLVLVAVIGFGICANAQSSCAVKVGGVTIGAVTAWTADGSIWASNDTDRQVTVTIEVEGGAKFTVVLPPAPKGQSVAPTRVKSSTHSLVKKVYNAICE